MGKIKGTDGDDYLTGTNGNDEYIGYEGLDLFVSSRGRDKFIGTDSLDHSFGDDSVFYSDGFTGYTDPKGVTVNLMTGKGIDGYGDTDTYVDIYNVTGSFHDDRIIGSNDDNELFGERGDDYLDGKGGYDFTWYGRAEAGVVVDLNSGKVTGGAGKDTLLNFEGVVGSNYSDKIYGSDKGGEWFALSEFGNKFTPNYKKETDDYLDGRGGSDGVFYSKYDFSVEIHLDKEFAIDAGGRRDTLISIENASGSQANDIIVGSSKANDLAGHGGKDTLSGLSGTDILRGGANGDTFVFSKNFDKDSITDFSISDHDRIDLSGMPSVADFQDLKSNHMTQSGKDVVLDFGGGDTLTIENIKLDTLSAGQFDF